MACFSAIGTKSIVVFKSSSSVNLMLPVRDKRAIVRAKMLTTVTMPAVTSPIFFFVSAFITSPIQKSFSLISPHHFNNCPRQYHSTTT